MQPKSSSQIVLNCFFTLIQCHVETANDCASAADEHFVTSFHCRVAEAANVPRGN